MSLKNCNFANYSSADLSSHDRFIFSGRRGTGKTTAIKKFIAEGHSAVWLCQSSKTVSLTIHNFVPPQLAKDLPPIEELTVEDFPTFKFGYGAVRVLPKTAIVNAKATGIYIGDSVPDLIVNDEIIRSDGRYAYTNEPEMVDDLAFTIGRTGKVPKILCACNPAFPPNENNNPYSIAWNVDLLGEGSYVDKKGLVTLVKGTADCSDCFGKKVGLDAEKRTWSAHLSTGGNTFEVNGKAIRVVMIGTGAYVGMAETGDICAVVNGRYTPEVYSTAVCKFILQCRMLHRKMLVVFDSFEAQLLFFEFIKDRG